MGQFRPHLHFASGPSGGQGDGLAEFVFHECKASPTTRAVNSFQYLLHLERTQAYRDRRDASPRPGAQCHLSVGEKVAGNGAPCQRPGRRLRSHQPGDLSVSTSEGRLGPFTVSRCHVGARPG